MSDFETRRQFLKVTAAGGALAGMGGYEFLRGLPPVSAAETKLAAKQVRLSPSIEPLVQLIEKTPRNALLETIAQKIRKGLSYRETLAALLLTGVRNVQPRPAVGFKFHAVLVVNSAHLASLSSPDSDRWLPIFWALDYCKSKQLEEERTSGWKLPPVDEKSVPPASRAKKALIDALEKWDEQAADVATASLARSAGSNEIFEILFRYGSRDFRSIGHKAIFVANSRRTLSCIGWQHAEPVLRSLVYAMLNHRGEPNPAKSDLTPDRPFRRNLELAGKIRKDYRDGKLNAPATRDMLSTLGKGSSNDACDLAVKLLNSGISPQSIWDAVFVGSGELLMRQPGIIGLHTLTTANAMHHAYSATGDDTTRRLLLLQSCAFLPMFRATASRRGRIKDLSVKDVKSTPLDRKTGDEKIGEIFADVSRDRMKAAGKIRRYLADGGSARPIIDAARRLIFSKGRDAHDYKYSSAVLEDYYNVSREFRDTFLALSVFNLKGSGHRDNPLVKQIRAALRSK